MESLKDTFATWADSIKSVYNYCMQNKDILLLVALVGLIFLLLSFINTNPFRNALLDDKVVVPKKDAYLDALINYLNVRFSDAPPYLPYTVSKNLRKHLCKNRFGQESIQALVFDILNTIGVPTSDLDVIVELDKESRFSGKSTAGLYVQKQGGRREIHLELKKTYSLNEVVAIICHECSHAFLNYHNVVLEDTQDNEALTDTCTIYLGFAQYMLLGYKPVKRISKITYTKTTTSARIQSSRIGYLSVGQLEYVCRKMKKARKKVIDDYKKEKRKRK